MPYAFSGSKGSCELGVLSPSRRARSGASDGCSSQFRIFALSVRWIQESGLLMKLPQEPLQGFVTDNQIADAVLCALAQVRQYVSIVPVRDPLGKREFRKAPWDRAADKTLRPKVLEKIGQSVAYAAVLRRHGIEPVLVTCQGVQSAE